jgi:hypothetical protein
LGKTSFNGNLANGQIAFSNKRPGVLHPALDHVLMNGHPDGLAERGVAVGDTHTTPPPSGVATFSAAPARSSRYGKVWRLGAITPLFCTPTPTST